ncbi:MAG: DnaJ domain-containing protein [Acidimicrobiia bacterium]
MPTGTRTRDWTKFDYYALLGIESTADADEVTRAFRDEAKRSHPDVAPDAVAAAHFSDVAAAYGVLGDPHTRRAYDQVRAESRRRAEVPANGAASGGVATEAPAVRKAWSRRRAYTALLSGVLVTVLGVGAAVLTWSMYAHDANQRSRYLPVTATRIDINGASMDSFQTRTGERVLVREPQQHGDPSALGPTVKIRYDPADPERVIADDNNMGRDITFTIVALKLLIGGPVFMVFGARRLRSATAAR